MKGVIVTGALGRMGSITVQMVADAPDLTLTAGVDVMGEVTSLEDVQGQAKVLIDFSHHTAAPAIMNWAAEHHVAVVMCTTGHTPEEQEATSLMRRLFNGAKAEESLESIMRTFQSTKNNAEFVQMVKKIR